jgi:AbrB family looped-hinge helix DNA binding protein
MEVGVAAAESTITAKGQATIPKSIRDHLGVGPGDQLKFFKLRDGRVVLLPKRPLSSLCGVISPPRKGVTIEDMNEAIAEGASAGFKRGRRRK